MWNRRITAAVLVAAAVAMSGCSENRDRLVGPGGNSGDGFDDVIASGGVFEEVTPSEEIVDSTVEDEVADDGTIYRCTTETYSVVGAPADYPTFDPNAEILYPGSLLQGGSLGQATPDPIVVDRSGGSVFINLLNSSVGVRQEVSEVNGGKVLEALNAILAENTGVVPARFTFQSEEVQSREQLAAHLDVSVNTLAASVGAELEFSSDRSYNRWIVTLNQSYYTMSFDLPASTSDLFAPNVTPSDLSRYVGPGNPATYISSVTYGRRFYLLVESTASRQEMRASIEASYNAAVVGGSIEGGVEYIKDLENSRIKVVAVGGEQSLALATFNGDFRAVSEFLTDGANINNGVPLSYVVRSVRDNKIVNVKLATEYDVRNCEPVNSTIENPIAWFDPEYGLEVGYTNPRVNVRFISRWKNAFGDPAGDGIPAGANLAGWIWEDGVNGVGDYVYFRKESTSGGPSAGALRFSGLDFRNSDYTIFVVTKPFSARYFLWGESRQPLERLSLGFLDEDTVTMSHGDGHTLEANLDDGSRWQLFTFRFSQTDGMSIYVNGRLAARNKTLTDPLEAFPGAQFGAAGPEFVGGSNFDSRFVEMKAYGTAATDAQRRAEEDALMIKYRL